MRVYIEYWLAGWLVDQLFGLLVGLLAASLLGCFFARLLHWLIA